jgi:hypothetical protein
MIGEPLVPTAIASPAGEKATDNPPLPGNVVGLLYLVPNPEPGVQG